MKRADEDQRLAAAADWLVRLRDPEVSPAEVSEWLAWCDATAENKQAFARMQSLWQESGELLEHPVAAAELAADRYLGQVPIGEWLARDHALGEKRRQSGGRHLRRPWPGVAAMVAVTVALGIFIVQPSTPLLSGSQFRDVSIETPVARNRTAVLPDGTKVTIAAGSSIATRYTRERRAVFLRHGEAFFQVKSDRNRPFTVQALDATVTAVGTAFNVRAEEGAVRVAVTEGSVEVDRRESAAGVDKIHLTQGHQVSLSRHEPVPIVVSVNAARATAWVAGTLTFVDEPLASVVAAVNRYSATPVSVVDPKLRELRYTGTVVAERVNEWLLGLPNVFPVAVSSSGAAISIEPQRK